MHKGLAALIALAALPLAATAQGFTEDTYDTFVANRAGTGEPVYWYSVGTIKAYPSGELLFRMEGFDTARVDIPDPEAKLANQFNRKIYFYQTPDTGEIISEWNGTPVEPIAYPYQFITYNLVGDRVETMVEQGQEPRVQRIGPGDSMSVRTVGDTLVVTAPVYLDFEIPGTGRRMDAFENYDFFFHPEGSVAEPQQLAWVRYGDLPAWAGGGKAIYHLITWRVEAFSDIPEPLRTVIETDYPLWTQPPADLAEIRALQAGQGADSGWGK